MITRAQIVRELKRHKNHKNGRSGRKKEMGKWLKAKKLPKKKMWVEGRFKDISDDEAIMSDLESYAEY